MAETATRTCIEMFGVVAGQRVWELVRSCSPEGLCPCERGERCPLVDADGRSPLLPSPASR